MVSSLPKRPVPLLLHKEDLARPAQDLPVKVIKTLGLKLHQEHANSGNWETLAEELGFTPDDIRDFRNMASVQRDQLPGEVMLRNWREKGSDRSLFVLLEALKRSDRLDCVTYLQNEIYDKVLCMDLYVCIMNKDRRVIIQEPVRTRSEATLQESLENWLFGDITEYHFVETGITWQRSRAHEFKGKQLTLICNLVLEAGLRTPVEQQNQLNITTAAGDGTKQPFVNNFMHVNYNEHLHSKEFKSLIEVQNRILIRQCEGETNNSASQSLHSYQNMPNMYGENASLETNVKQVHELINDEEVVEDTCSCVLRGEKSDNSETKQHNVSRACLKLDLSSKNSYQNEAKIKGAQCMGMKAHRPVIKDESLKHFRAQQVFDMLGETSSEDSGTLDHCVLPTPHTVHTINTPSEAESIAMQSSDSMIGEIVSDDEDIKVPCTKPYPYEMLQHNQSWPSYSGYTDITIADVYTPVTRNILQPFPENFDTEVKQSTQNQQACRNDERCSAENGDGNDTRCSTEICSIKIGHRQFDCQHHDIDQGVRPYPCLKRQTDLMQIWPQTEVKQPVSLHFATATTYQATGESSSPVHSELQPISLPSTSRMQHVPQRSFRNAAPHPYKLLPGTGSRPLLDSSLANDRVFSHFNTTLHGFPGWCPRETENTVKI